MVFCILFLLLFTFSCGTNIQNSSRTQETIEVSTIKERTYLRDGWNYYYGDSLDFSKADYDDTAWGRVNFPVIGFSVDAKRNNFCWFRKEIRVSKELEGETLSVFMGKLPDACEVYFNGSKIGVSGSLPPHKVFSTPNIPRAYTIPSGLVNFGGKNVLSIRVYIMRGQLSFGDIFITDEQDKIKVHFLEYFLSSVLSMFATALSIILFFYYFLLFIREKENVYNLYAAIAFPLLAISFSTDYLESSVVDYLLLTKFQFASLYMSLVFFAFYFQEFFKIHNKKSIRVLLFSGGLFFSIILFMARSVMDFEYLNGSLFYPFWVTPMLFYILTITIIAIRKGGKYASFLIWGLIAIISTGLHDMMCTVISVQPRFWMASWGMNIFILFTFFSSANWSVDMHKESIKKSKLLEKQRDVMRDVFKHIKEVSEKVFESGRSLNRTINDSSAFVQQIVLANQTILNHVKDQMDSVERNKENIQQLLQSIQKIALENSQQSALMEESNIVIGGILSSISKIHQAMEESRSITEHLSKVAEEGRLSVSESSRAIKAIEDSSKNVREMIKDISDIADKTGILSMNAAIQSAHAGEYGKGFAVVAEEVRTLAENSTNSITQINQYISEMYERTEDGVKIFNKVQEGLVDILEGAKGTVRLMESVSSIAREQQGKVAEAVKSINSLVKACGTLKEQTDSQIKKSEEIRVSLEALSAVASSIKKLSEEQSEGSTEILKSLEKMKEVSGENELIIQELERIIAEAEKSQGE